MKHGKLTNDQNWINKYRVSIYKKVYNLYKLQIAIMQLHIRDTGLYVQLKSSHLRFIKQRQ